MSRLFADSLFNAMEKIDPAPGMLLLASPGLASDDFARSVILLLEHNEMRSFGVNLVARSDIAIGNVLPEWIDLVAKPKVLYIGGPINQQAVVGVGVTKPDVDIAQHDCLTRLANRLVHIDLHTPPQQLDDLIQEMRMFVGYAEWAPGQLAEEIECGEWYVTPALPSDVTAAGVVDVWGSIMRRQPMPLPLFSTYPEEITDN
ncbi:YqgE/AlgH family protein [Corynebacterium sp. sy039]|uniref:YqgE/AlgH family protein n=1 Tax=Corynebacterium sp. sy039 TaxID=2599641 RepID=UPI0011B4473F|nr:YqgE/AlgH family protein [Corynebacterium sp. sy039]QDZ43646.1 YqgE/AlgH family protein [Corynebacterium sp. sy039]